MQGYFGKLKWSKNSQQKWILYTLLSWKNMNVIKPTTSRKIRWVGGLNLFKKGYMCILRSGSVFWHFVKLWVIEWEELIIKDMAMHTIVLLLEAAGNVNRKAKVFHAMHNWILNGLLMTLAGASQQHCCVFYTHKYISIRLGSCMYYSQVNCRLKVNYIRKIWVSLPTAQLAVKHWPEKESLYLSNKYSFQAPWASQMSLAAQAAWKEKLGLRYML